MNTRNSRTIMIVALFAAAILALPALAQHDGGTGSGHDQHQGMNDQMGGMHSGEMMEQMTTMMDNMSQMIGDMHELHEQFGTMMQHQEHTGETAGDPGEMMQPLVGDMDEMLPHMENMVSHMRSVMDQPHAEAIGESMDNLMKQMDLMLMAGRDAMATINGIAAEGQANSAQTDHSGQNH